MKEQLTLRGIIIGVIGAVLITTSSMFIALKLSSLPWPIIFVSLMSMFSLKAMGGTNLREVNVTQTAMSAGAMVAGGLAFTVPGIWMLYGADQVSWTKLLIVTLIGVALGLIFTALLRNYFLDQTERPFPLGEACARTLEEGDKGGKKARVMFLTMLLTAAFTFLKDWFRKIPALFVAPSSYGASLGVYVSPMLVAIGYVIGFVPVFVWFIGALISDFGILIGGISMGFWELPEATSIKQSLGIGLMVGTGIGIILKLFLNLFKKRAYAQVGPSAVARPRILGLRWAGLVAVACAFVLTLLCGLSPLTSVLILLGTGLATILSSECVGMTGINPMEIFGIIVLIVIRALGLVDGVECFFVAACVAVACGLCGDVMNDFKAGKILETDPKAQWIGEVIGGLVGALVSIGVLMVIVMAYGADSFGSAEFPAAQASAVAAMIGGISHLPAFLIGLCLASVLYMAGLPVITLGLGVYLPFYMSATVFLGGLIRFVMDRINPKFEKNGWGGVLAAGLLGGEGITGVLIALMLACGAL